MNNNTLSLSPYELACVRGCKVYEIFEGIRSGSIPYVVLDGSLKIPYWELATRKQNQQ